MTTTSRGRGRIIVPGEPPRKAAPSFLFSTELVSREFARLLKQKSSWDLWVKIGSLRASMPREDEDGRQDG